MIITWDEPKRVANIAEHRMDFAELDEAFFEAAAFKHAHSRRLLAIGKRSNRMIAVVFKTLGREGISIISMRPASKKERKFYAER
ncbi:BrnT family toxin [soil metagenome]